MGHHAVCVVKLELGLARIEVVLVVVVCCNILGLGSDNDPFWRIEFWDEGDLFVKPAAR